jgi:hypothetical protein
MVESEAELLAYALADAAWARDVQRERAEQDIRLSRLRKNPHFDYEGVRALLPDDIRLRKFYKWVTAKCRRERLPREQQAPLLASILAQLEQWDIYPDSDVIIQRAMELEVKAKWKARGGRGR